MIIKNFFSCTIKTPSNFHHHFTKFDSQIKEEKSEKMKMKRKNFLDSFRSPGLLTQGGLALNEMTDEKNNV